MCVNVLATPKIKALLQELESWGLENDRVQTDRSRKMLNLERETAELVRALIVGWQPRRILEIGTSNGYSTIWFAASVGQGGSVISIERDPAKLELAKENLLRAEVLGRTELLLGDATETVASLPGPFDVVFFDADRLSAPDQLALLLPKLSHRALLLADNVLSHPEEIAGYLAVVRALPEFEHVIVPVGKGLSIAHRS